MIRFSDDLVQSGLLKKEPYLILLGFPTKEILHDLEKVFDLTGYGTSNTLISFVNYAEIDIKVGTKFRKLFEPRTKLVEDIDCTLTGVTQQFFKPFDYIPAGWKTICQIKFLTRIPKSIEALPAIDDWFQGPHSVLLMTEEFHRQLMDLNGISS